ncbi:uncharacterized protein LOC122390795 [Amphibalanus amphitrite]|uniref:uncharacterized protein LOC122390795 n=1 Tax=Amphibalanus amphitrite TaxID=1232801 RepID=UPI001C8FCE65|nr:uncharacterized protein LOC122390795 [Amphibalanus amphitrite]
MARFRQALIEERTARQTIEKDIWKAIGRLEQKVCPPKEKCDRLLKATCSLQQGEANSLQQEETSSLQEEKTSSVQQEKTCKLQQDETCIRQEGDGEDVTTPTDDAPTKCDVINSDDVTTQAAPAGGDLNKTDPSETNIDILDTDALKKVLCKLNCREMLRARRVCRSWRSAVDDIVDDCRRKLADRSARGFNTLTLTNLELVIRAKDQPKMTSLKAPTAEKGTDIRLVVGSCHALQTADLRGFKLRVSALRRLARANASSLRELTLPAGIGDCQLEALLEPLEVLERLNLSLPVNSTGKWLWLLPKSLKKLDITGSGMTRSPVSSVHSSKLRVGIQLATDKLLDQLSVLSNRQPDYRVTTLTILESPSVTPGALARLLASLTSLWWVKLGVVGATLETKLAALRGCSELCGANLADPRPLTDIPALTQSEVAAVSRMAVTCRKLEHLYLTSSAANCQAVLTALLKADLGRTIYLSVPRAVKGELSKPPNGSSVYVSYFD